MRVLALAGLGVIGGLAIGLSAVLVLIIIFR